MSTRSRLVLAAVCAACAIAPSTHFAADKNGVSPQAISLPSGPGSVQGLGESYQPQLNTGSGSYQVEIALPRGAGGHTPSLALAYNTGSPNSAVGLGWTISGVSSIARSTDEGVPLYVDGPDGADNDHDGRIDNPEEIDRVSGVDGEELVELSGGSFRAESEGSFRRYRRSGAGWEAHSKDGTRFEYGMSPQARVEGEGGTFRWCLERVVDTSGNAITYRYLSDAGAPAQKYCGAIRWGQPAAFYEVLLTYGEGRPDVFTDFRGGFAITTALRLARIEVISQGLEPSPGAERGDLNGDGVEDALIRRYELSHDAGAAHSLLAGVVQLGNDGVTALPELRFEYSRWTPPENAAATVIRSVGEPAQVLNSESVDLVDFNRDALPDLIATTGGQHRIALNAGVDSSGRLTWTPARPVAGAPSFDIASGQVHLADGTADGLADLVVKVSPTRFECWDNSGELSWLQPRAPLTKTDTWPLWPFEGTEGAKSRSLDCDHNRCNDILFTSTNGISLWLLLEGGQYAREIRLPPLRCDGQTFRFDLPGAHIADVNGDRLQDIVWVQSTRVAYWPSRGRGVFEEPRVLPLGASLSLEDIEKTGFADIDGDSLVDLTVVRPSGLPRGVRYWLNRFESGLEAPRVVEGIPARVSGDALRWADMNGNGSTDIVISNASRPPGQRILVVDLVPGGKPNLLTRIDNGLGRRVELEYESSVDQMVRAAGAGEPWSRTSQISISVVRRQRVEDGLGPAQVREFTYRDPFYDTEKQEFRGFERAEDRELGDEGVPGKITRFRFDLGVDADCLKGRVLEQEVGDAELLFNRTDTTWSHRVLGRGEDGREVCYAFATASDVLVVEGQRDGIELRTEMEHDDFGNVVIERKFGIVDAPGDELFTAREYDLRPEAWLMGLVARELTADGEGRRVGERRFEYDDRGLPTREEAWLSADGDGERFVPVRRTSYDAFGNAIEVLDANGHRRAMAYDAVLHIYPIMETVHLEAGRLEMEAEYDLNLGVVTSARDFAGATLRFRYDALGRLVEAEPPGGARTRHEYVLSEPVSHVVTRVRESDPGGEFETYAYFDGLGRALGSKVEAGVDGWRFQGAKAYNARGLERFSWQPYFTESREYETPDAARPRTEMRYDAQGRPVAELLPDGNRRAVEYTPLAVHEWDEMDTAGAATPTTTRHDGLERVVEIIERSGEEILSTTQVHDTRGDITRITDPAGNVLTMAYDSLRRKVREDSPDCGIRRFEYDDVGNLTRRIDARGQVTEFTYDFADRLLSEDFVDPDDPSDPVDIIYLYDIAGEELDFGDGTLRAAQFTGGRIASVRDASGEEHVSYDGRGNVVWKVKRIADPRSGLLIPYATESSYDLMDRLTETVYPDGDRARFVWGEDGLLARIDGGPGGAVVLESVRYEPSGARRSVRHGNGTAAAYSYDERLRLTSSETLSPAGRRWMDFSYSYDEVSNVVGITDGRPLTDVPGDSPRRNTQIFAYDDLYRLTQFRLARLEDPAANHGQIDYTYDGLGNLLGKTTSPAGTPGHIDDPRVVLGAYSYGGGRASRVGRSPGDPPGPHAVTATESGGRYAYDDNGNLVSRGDAALDWDARDRLVSHEGGAASTRYVHDHADRRVIKITESPAGTAATFYVSRDFEVRPGGVETKYIFDGEARLARIQGTLDPGRDRVQRLVLTEGWNSLVISVETGRTAADIFGPDSEVYTRENGLYRPLDPGGERVERRPLWVLAETPRVVVVRGAYEPDTTGFTLSGGEQLFAWPRLEPLVPELHFGGERRVGFFDNASRSWSFSGPNVPAFLRASGALPPSATYSVRPAGTVQVSPSSGPFEIVFFHHDHLGSSAIVTDGAGELLEETTFYPYGAVRTRHRMPEWFRSPFAFTGQELDGESGLQYHGARYYLPELGRWASCDPAGLVDGLNLYQYSRSNPVRFVDPEGTDDEDATAGAGGSPGGGGTSASSSTPRGGGEANPDSFKFRVEGRVTSLKFSEDKATVDFELAIDHRTTEPLLNSGPVAPRRSPRGLPNRQASFQRVPLDANVARALEENISDPLRTRIRVDVIVPTGKFERKFNGVQFRVQSVPVHRRDVSASAKRATRTPRRQTPPVPRGKQSTEPRGRSFSGITFDDLLRN